MTRRRKPTDPAQLTKQKIERAEREEEIQRLIRLGATVTTDPARRVVSAYRSNFANLLLSRGTITPNHHDAVARLVEAWAVWKGLAGRSEQGSGKVDQSTQPQPLVTDRMIRAGREVTSAIACSQPHERLLTAFMVATVEEDRPMAWRGLVERHTGETRERHQTQLVVAMLDQLAAFYQAPKAARAA